LRISKEFKVGIIFVAALILLYWGFNFLSGLSVFNKQRIFYAKYDKVNGLVVANPISINGLRVGQVKALYFDPNGKGLIIAELLIEDPIPVPDNSVARISSSDLLGSKVIDLKLGNSSRMAEPGDTLRSRTDATLSEEVNLQLLPLKKKAEDLIGSIDSVVTLIQTVLNKNTRENLVASIDNIKLTISNLASTTHNIDTLVSTEKNRISGIISNIESISRNLRQNNDQISNVIRNFSTLSDSLAASQVPTTLRKVGKTLTEINVILDKINRGEGTLGMLVNNDTLYQELEKSAAELNKLIEDIKANPRKYLKISVF